MKLSIALLATTLAVAEASSDSAASGLAATLRRRLSFAKIAGYTPGSQVRFLVFCMHQLLSYPIVYITYVTYKHHYNLGNRPLRHRSRSKGH